MTRLCFAFLAILAVASAFTTPVPMKAASKPLFMFSAEDGQKSAAKSSGLAEVAPGESADALEIESFKEEDTISKEGMQVKQTMVVKNRNTGKLVEVEVNESFIANGTGEMSWWAWAGFVILPAVLLSNDVFHYIPADGPLKFLVKY